MPQSFENHTRMVPAFHYIALPILAINILWSVYRMLRWFSADTAIAAAVSVALILVAFCARMFALTVQDRVIRLEMEMRLKSLLPADLLPRACELTIAQLVSLRFAPDAQLPALTRKVLDENLQNRKSIKKLIKDWKPDLLRA